MLVVVKLKGATMSNRPNREPEYSSWISMRRRCLEKGNNRYYRYGGRGITICKAWSVYETFLRDMGRKPHRSYSIERIDVDGNYEPRNCKWASRLEQGRNRKDTVRFRGVSLRKLCQDLSLPYAAAWCRLKNGHNPLVPLRGPRV